MNKTVGKCRKHAVLRDSAQCLFCPAHTNTHDFERYEKQINITLDMVESANEQIWSNYQYVGQKPRGEDDDGLLTKMKIELRLD